MLNQVQHDRKRKKSFRKKCHSEPCPETSSGSMISESHCMVEKTLNKKNCLLVSFSKNLNHCKELIYAFPTNSLKK